jgi:flagellar basal body P-ring formation protein FlgA
MLRLALALLYLILSGLPALAQITGALPPSAIPPTPVLKREVTVAHDIVRIGDLIENAGAHAMVPIFRAPDLGHTGTVPAARVIEAVRQHGYTIVETHGVREVAVTRASRVITVKDLEARIAAVIASQPGVGDVKNLSVTIERDARSLVLEPNAGELQATRTYYEPRSGRFEVTFEVPGSALARRLPPLRYSGTAIETVEATVVARPIGRGDVIKASDIAIERRPKAEVRGDVVKTLDDVAGLAARRALRAGELLRAADLAKPEIVLRNEQVTLVYEAPGLVLTIRGKALESGAQGDVINVVNIQSKRTVQGTVTGPGQVTLASSRPVARATTAASEAIEPSRNE